MLQRTNNGGETGDHRSSSRILRSKGTQEAYSCSLPHGWVPSETVPTSGPLSNFPLNVFSAGNLPSAKEAQLVLLTRKCLLIQGGAKVGLQFILVLLLLLLLCFKKVSYLFLERGEGREWEGKKHQCVVASRVPPTRDLARNPGMCPDWKSNWWPLGWQAHTQPTEPHQ